MKSDLKRFFKRRLQSWLNGKGYDLILKGQSDYVRSFLPLEETLQKAKSEGLTVSDYVDKAHNEPGATQRHFDRLVDLGVFEGGVDRVCEIGPGTGRYLERTIKACHPKQYEVYETARDWASWLEQSYPLVVHPADGQSLKYTLSGSIDVVMANKVFVYVPFLTTCRYWQEMVRVVRQGGKVVFDIVTEACMDETTLGKWLASGMVYPSIMPKQYAVDFFVSRGFRLMDSIFVPMRPGRTECMVFVAEGRDQ